MRRRAPELLLIRRGAPHGMPLAALLCAGLLLCGCKSVESSDSTGSTQLTALREQVKTLQEANTLLDLKLQDEIERSTIQIYLTRQEIAAAKRETAALRAKCGPPCAEAAP